MTRRRRPEPDPTPPRRLYGLTGNQARTLREALDKIEMQEARGRDIGLYLGIGSKRALEAAELADGGAGTIEEVPMSGGTRGPHDPRPCEWVDRYFLPNFYGILLLGRHEAIVKEERERRFR